jgi:inosine/xanthosine triphosphate pyrophosphatase family protein
MYSATKWGRIGDPAYGDLTMAQLTLEQKNRASHRAVVVGRMIEMLRRMGSEA